MSFIQWLDRWFWHGATLVMFIVITSVDSLGLSDVGWLGICAYLAGYERRKDDD